MDNTGIPCNSVRHVSKLRGGDSVFPTVEKERVAKAILEPPGGNSSDRLGRSLQNENLKRNESNGMRLLTVLNVEPLALTVKYLYTFGGI